MDLTGWLIQWALANITIGDPGIFTGANATLFYGGIIAAVIASVFAWWYENHRQKANNNITQT